jgi:hypothetical protein
MTLKFHSVGKAPRATRQQMGLNLKNLSLRQIITIARRYDLDPRDRIVVSSAKQADQTHGLQCDRPNWGTDHRGVYQADKLLDGYLCEETRVMRCDALAARQFDRDAYGVDT